MCGFLILKSNNFTKESKKSFLKSLNFLKRRGPDETKVLIRKKFLIGFTRLSINDHKTASQPFISNCKKYIIVFNGEIINYKYTKFWIIIIYCLSAAVESGSQASTHEIIYIYK